MDHWIKETLKTLNDKWTLKDYNIKVNFDEETGFWYFTMDKLNYNFAKSEKFTGADLNISTIDGNN